MTIKIFEFNPFYENTYVLFDEEQKDCIIVDPGCYEKYERDEIVNFISDNSLIPKILINTHCHIDHVLGNAFLKRQFGIPLWVPEGEKEMLKSVEVYAPSWGISGFESTEIDKLYNESESVQIGKDTLTFIFTPGHSPGHMMIHHEPSKSLISGDVIFHQSIGRTDLPGGNYEELENSIRTKVYNLDDSTTIYPGHGPATTVGFEKSNNPFVSA